MKKNILVIGGIGVDDCYFIDEEEYEKRKIKKNKEKKCDECVHFGSRFDLGWDRDVLHMHCYKTKKDINGTITTAKKCLEYEYNNKKRKI